MYWFIFSSKSWLYDGCEGVWKGHNRYFYSQLRFSALLQRISKGISVVNGKFKTSTKWTFRIIDEGKIVGTVFSTQPNYVSWHVPVTGLAESNLLLLFSMHKIIWHMQMIKTTTAWWQPLGLKKEANVFGPKTAVPWMAPWGKRESIPIDPHMKMSNLPQK